MVIKTLVITVRIIITLIMEIVLVMFKMVLVVLVILNMMIMLPMLTITAISLILSSMLPSIVRLIISVQIIHSFASLQTIPGHRPTYKFILHPLHAANERLVSDGVGDHGFHVDGERLFEQNHVVLRQSEGVHVARVEFPASVDGSYFLGFAEHGS